MTKFAKAKLKYQLISNGGGILFGAALMVYVVLMFALVTVLMP